jgi:small subunit ribosomal protein S3
VKTGTFKLDVLEVKAPDLDARLVALSIAKELEQRASFRTAQKKAIQRVKKAGAKGIKTMVTGRLGGAEIARGEGYHEGIIPLHTLRSDIDFAKVEAHTTYGRLGVKVWICRGDYDTTAQNTNQEKELIDEPEAVNPAQGE